VFQEDNKEDCAEAPVPELQALLSAGHQGIVSSVICSYHPSVFSNVVSDVHSLLHQRCKHFEIGGDKKGKGTSLF
jgi:hypothetical protein